MVFSFLLRRYLPPHAPGEGDHARMRRRLIAMSVPLAISSASVTIYSQVDKLVLGYFDNLHEVGQYSLARAVMEVALFPAFALVTTLRPALASRFTRGDNDDELPDLVGRQFAFADTTRQGIFGHSMGGHGALVLALRQPQRYRSVSAFAPIVAPSQVPWGHKALPRYLGTDREGWRGYDACALLADGARFPGTLLVDQGDADRFLDEQLQPQRLEHACAEAGQALELRMRPGYDHSYWFIQTFVGDHLRHHARALSD